MSDDFSDCRCGSCCLPTIVAERDEALIERDAAVTAKVQAQAVMMRAENHERASLRELDDAVAERDAANAKLARAVELLRLARDNAYNSQPEAADAWRTVRAFLAEMEAER